MELAGLCLVPSFFLVSVGLEGLYRYLIVSRLSSALIIRGLVVEGLASLVFWGFIVKLGIFPFVGWVYSVVSVLGWLSVWLFSTFLKVPVFMLRFYCRGAVPIVCEILVGVRFLMLGVYFWLFTSG